MEEENRCPDTQQPNDFRAARRAFSRIGFAFCALLILWNAVNAAFSYAVSGLWPDAAGEMWVRLFVNAVALYGCAIPVFFLLVRRMPAALPADCRMRGGDFWIALLMCYALMIGGNLAGMLVTGLFQLATGLETGNAAYDILTSGESFAALFVTVGLLAPLFEELLCRKLILDRLYPYGRKTALIVSALAFGALHGNLSQFFYAAALGLLFGYIYMRTGKLRYSVLLHMIINTFSLVLSTLMSDFLTMGEPSAELFLTMSLPQILRLLAAGLLIMLEYGCALAGLVLLILRRKCFVLPDGETRLIPPGRRLSAALANPGCIAAMVCTAAFFAIGYFS